MDEILVWLSARLVGKNRGVPPKGPTARRVVPKEVPQWKAALAAPGRPAGNLFPLPPPPGWVRLVPSRKKPAPPFGPGPRELGTPVRCPRTYGRLNPKPGAIPPYPLSLAFSGAPGANRRWRCVQTFSAVKGYAQQNPPGARRG